ncbi:thioredoxin [Longitalea arenae]|uniref:thioredoxin n=1 Tax=Longitalea arenae TaxID=2812558 RepID=UPI001F073283|nr:thioredoxin [Longitalea arenae]
MRSSFLFSLLIPVIALFMLANHQMAAAADNTSGGGTVEFTDANFQKKVLASDKLTLVDFWATWCGPCRRIGPVVEDLANTYSGKVNIGKLNVDHNPNVCMKYDIRSIPTILFIKNGKVIDRVVGAVSKSTLDKKIKAHM